MVASHYLVTNPTDGVWIQVANEYQIQRQLDALAARNPAHSPRSLAVKANIGVDGFSRSAGCQALFFDLPDADAPVVAALKNAGHVVVGMTNMHELAFGITSENATYGTVRLPGHPDRSAGGSSGGSAAAVAEGTVDIALGTDTGGSVSIPASHCGVYGFRPSTGRWSTAEITGLSWTRDTPGIFARTFEDITDIDTLITGQPQPTSATPLRIGVPKQLHQALDPHTKRAVDDALCQLENHATVIEVDYRALLELTNPVEAPIVWWEAPRLLAATAAPVFDTTPDDALEQLAEEVDSPDVADALAAALADPVTAADYATAQQDVGTARNLYAALLAEHNLDALVFPATPAPAPVIGSQGVVTHLGQPTAVFPLYMRNTVQGTVLGAPMATLPLPVAPGELPAGLTVQGARFADPHLLATAQHLQSVLNFS